jgi:4-hydroxybenzoate polyprenyltransferase
LKRLKIEDPTSGVQFSGGSGDNKRREELYRLLINDAKKGDRPTTRKESKLKAWVQLLRLPNLLTVPGDPIVGFFSWSSIRYYSSSEKGYLDIGNVVMLVPCILSVLMLYCAGLILNDLMDLNEDRRDRRYRPLPSERISARSASVVLTVMFVGGLVAAWFNGTLCAGVAGVLSLAIVTYNAGAKRIPIIGPLNMGLCRGLSVFMGLAISSSLHLGQNSPDALITWAKLSMLLSWPFFSITPMILYIALIAFIASDETKPGKMRILPWMPAATVAIWMICLIHPHPQWDSPLSAASLLIIAGLPVAMAVTCGYRLNGEPEPKTVQRVVGELVGNLLLIQAAAVYFNSYSTNAQTEALPFAIALGLAYPVFILLCRRFYAS